MSQKEPKTIGEMFGSNLLYCRRQVRMTQQELAKLVGVESAEIDELERGAEWPDIVAILRLAAATNLSRPGLLLEGMAWVPGGEHPIAVPEHLRPGPAFWDGFRMEYIPGHFTVGVGLEDEETMKARIRKRVAEDRPVLDRLAEDDE